MSRIRITSSQLRPGVKVQTKPFSKKLEKAVAGVLSDDYDIESYCGLKCKVVSVDGLNVKLFYQSRSGYSSQFNWPVDCLSQGFGIEI